MEEEQENNQDQLLLKQELLKSEIVAKNYDGNKFLQFCLNKKENGDDMNNWTYDELKQCVEDFIESQKPKTKDNPEEKPKEENLQEKEEEKNENNNIIEEPKVNIDENEYIILNKEEKKDENFFSSKIQELSCKLLEKSLLSNKEIKVTIKNPKTNEKRLSQTYVTYEVFTEPSCWSVRRRYSDFLILRQILCKYYPRLLIPPLPEKKNWK